MINHSMTNKLCLNCDKEFSVKTSHVKRGGGKFCSRLCVTQHNNKNRKYLNLVCKKCHKEFQSKNKGAKFCSRICYDLTREAEFLKERGVSRSSLYFRKNKEKIYEQRRKFGSKLFYKFVKTKKIFCRISQQKYRGITKTGSSFPDKKQRNNKCFTSKMAQK